MEESVKEMKLSLTGLVDDGDLVEVGKMAGVHVFITGTVNQTEREYLITLKMIDVETGIVTGVETVSVEKEVLLDKKKELAFEYISQYGLGINLQYGMGLIDSPLNDYSLDILDLFVNYRPYMWLNFKLGISQYSYRPQSISGIPFSSIYTDFGSFTPGSSLGSAVNYNSAFFNTLGIYGGIDGNWTPAEFFTLGVGIGVNSITPTMIQNYTPLIVNNAGTLEAEGNLIIEQQFWPLTILRLEVKPQFFLSPRMTLGLYGALMFSNDVQVYKTTVNGDIYYAEDFADGEGIDNYIGLDPRMLGDGRNIEDLNFNMKYIIGVSINFYF
jgi:hypothetical protein